MIRIKILNKPTIKSTSLLGDKNPYEEKLKKKLSEKKKKHGKIKK